MRALTAIACLWVLLGRAAAEPLPRAIATLSFSAEKVADECDAGRLPEAQQHLKAARQALVELGSANVREALQPLVARAAEIDQALTARDPYRAATRADQLAVLAAGLVEPYAGDAGAQTLRMAAGLRSVGREAKRKDRPAALAAHDAVVAAWTRLKAVAEAKQPKETATVQKAVDGIKKALGEDSFLAARRAAREALDAISRLSALVQ